MKVLAIANQKGGCGKTITSINLSGALAEMGERVLLMDLDPQAHATSGLGVNGDAQALTTYEIFRAFMDERKLDINDIKVRIRGEFYLAPSAIVLSTVEQELTKSVGAVFVVRDFIRENLGSKLMSGPAASLSDPTFCNYFELDYIIIDCPPSLGFLTFNALSAADEVIVPIDMSSFALQGIKNIEKMVNALEEKTGRRPRIRYLMTLYDKRSKFGKVFLERAREKFGDAMFEAVIRSSIKLREAASKGKTIFEYDPLSLGAEDHWKLAHEVAGVSTPTIAKEFFIEAPHAQRVFLVGDFNNWQADDNASLIKKDDKTWTMKLRLGKGTYKYKYIVDGQWQHDLANPMIQDDPFGGKDSLLVVE